LIKLFKDTEKCDKYVWVLFSFSIVSKKRNCDKAKVKTVKQLPKSNLTHPHCGRQQEKGGAEEQFHSLIHDNWVKIYKKAENKHYSSGKEKSI